MVINLRKPWFIDGRTNEIVCYDHLMARLDDEAAGISPLFQPLSARAALQEIAAAVVREQDMILFDTDFGATEIQALGYSPTQLNHPGPVQSQTGSGANALTRQAGGRSRARLGLFTSGSTGLPKLVWQGVANLARVVKVSPRHAESVWALAYNTTHVAAVQVYLQALANGCTVVQVHGLSRNEVLAALRLHRVTHLSATPSFYRLLLPVESPLLDVRSVSLGGESADSRLLAKLGVVFPNARFHNVYASTEAGTLLVADGDVFSIAAGLESRVVLSDGRLKVHRSLLGEFAGGALTDEWYDTGDVVEMLSEQPARFRIVARERDWVNVGGSKVNPHEVEAVLGEHSGVAQVRVFGRKNSVMGHILCAEVVLAKADSVLQTAEGGRVTEAALRAFAAVRLQPFKIPRVILFVEALATTRTGKISRTEDGR